MPKVEKHNYRSAQNNISVSCQQQQPSSRPMTLITEVDNCRDNRQVHSEVSNMPVGASSSFSAAADGLSSALAQLHLHQQQQRLSPADLHWLAGAIARSSSPASRHQLLAALSRSVNLPASTQADVRGQVSGTQHVSTTQPPTAGQQAGTLPVSRYKTELCRSYEESGYCRYGDKCQFAHGCGELRSLSRHPKYKTERCRTFHTVGFCAYGSRCHFIHDKDEEQVVAPVPPRHHQKQQPVLSPADSCQSSLSSPMSTFEDADVGTSSVLATGSLHLALLNLVNEEQDACSVHSTPLSHRDVISASSSASCSPQPAVWQDGYHAHWSPLCSLDVEMYGYPTFSPSSIDSNEHKQQLAGHSRVFTFNDAPSSPSAESQASSSGSSSEHASDDSSSATYSPTLAAKHTTFASLLHP